MAATGDASGGPAHQKTNFNSRKKVARKAAFEHAKVKQILSFRFQRITLWPF
jgi:hypothetical protein